MHSFRKLAYIYKHFYFQTHCTLSPIPGFRAWLLRCLHEHSEYGMLIFRKSHQVLKMRSIFQKPTRFRSNRWRLHNSHCQKGHRETEPVQRWSHRFANQGIFKWPIGEIQDFLFFHKFQIFSAERISLEQLDLLREPLMYACAQYLYLAKRNGYSLNSVGKLVTNFELL